MKKFINSVAPNVFKPIQLTDLANKTVAIDAMGFFYRYNYVHEGKNIEWLFRGLNSFCKMNLVVPIYVFDGNYYATKNRRKIQSRFLAVKELLEKTPKLMISSQDDVDALKKWGEEGYLSVGPTSKLATLFKVIQSPKELDPPEISNIMKQIKIETKKMERQLIDIKPVVLEVIDSLKKQGSKAFQVKVEGEQGCGVLVKNNIADYVVSEDIDTNLFYNVTSIIGFKKPQMMSVSTNDLLSSLKLTHDELRDMAVIAGNSMTKGLYNIGHKRSYDLIKSYKSIENIRLEKPNLFNGFDEKPRSVYRNENVNESIILKLLN